MLPVLNTSDRLIYSNNILEIGLTLVETLRYAMQVGELDKNLGLGDGV